MKIKAVSKGGLNNSTSIFFAGQIMVNEKYLKFTPENILVFS